MEYSENILFGPDFPEPENVGSCAEFLIPRMKAHPKDLVIQVDCANDESITSHDFLRQSLETAEGLIELGLKQGDVVVFACTNNIRSHVTATGIFLSGGVFAPIDQNLKNFELQVLFQQFQPEFVICEKVKVKEIQGSLKSVSLDPKIILIDSAESNGEFFGWKDIRTKVDVDNYVPRKVSDPKKAIALISCSSGTLGLPKGVALSHYSTIYNILLAEKMHSSVIEKPFLLCSPFFWISGSIFLLNSCSFGGLCYISKSTDAEDILMGIEKSKTYFLLLAPSSIISVISNPNFKKYDVSSVKLIISAGATLSPSVTEKFKQIWAGVILLNIYGLTETFGSVTTGLTEDRPNSIGKLIPGVKGKVVDLDTGKCLGPNKTGELRINTKKLMNGYYNSEEATKAAFDEEGWLRTGDLVYYNEDGVIFFIGRVKETIDYRNFKIAPAEIESYIIGLPGVKDVIVVPVPHEFDTNHLKALVVKDPDSDITAEDIIQGVKENFTERKQLTEGVQFVDSLPRTKVGKLKRMEAQKLVQLEKK